MRKSLKADSKDSLPHADILTLICKEINFYRQNITG